MSTIQVNGTGFLTSAQLALRFSQSDGGGITDNRFIPEPNVGLPPAGYAVLQWTDTLIEVGVSDATVEGLFLAEVDVQDSPVTYVVSYDLTPDIVVPAALTYPLIESICSPAQDTIRFEGQRFLTATAGAVGYVIPRLAEYATGALMNGPNMIVDLSNVPANWTLVTHTDNVIELSNPDFTNEEPFPTPGDFVVNGAAFHDPTATTMYYYEPPENIAFAVPVDGAGC